MPISILVEPAANGYRAITGAPLDLVVEAATLSDAVAALQAKIADRLRGGAVLIEQTVAPASPIPVLALAENPLFDDWLRAVEDYRSQRDAEERAATAEAGEAMGNFVLDTDTLSLYQRGHAQVVAAISAHSSDLLAVCSVTLEEQISG